MGFLIRIRVCAGPAFSDLLLHSSGSFKSGLRWSLPFVGGFSSVKSSSSVQFS